jgi:riboflavin transporter FmnP
MAATTRGIRYPVLTDTANVPRDLGYAAADVEAWLARLRIYRKQSADIGVATGVTLTTIVIPAQPIACRVFIEVKGTVGNAAGAATLGAVAIAVSAGTLNGVLNQPVYLALTGIPYVGLWVWYLDLPVSTGTTLTFTSSANTTADYRMDYAADLRYAGEYA